ncbi:MAG: MFS transporter [Thermoprotei archaeon]
MRHLVFLAILILTYFSASYMYANVVKPMWEEGVIPGEIYNYEAIAGFYLLTIPAVIGVILSIPMGMLADKIGKVKMLIITGLLIGAGLLIISGSPNLYILVIGFTLFAIGMHGIYPAIMGAIADTLPESRRGIGYASYYASSVLGNIVGLIIGLIIYWRTGYLSLGLLVILLTFITSFTLTRAYEKAGVGITRREYVIGTALRATLTPPAIAFYILIFFWGMPWGAIARYAVNFICDAWGVSRGIATLIVVLGSLSIIAGHILGGLLADRRVRKGDPLGRVKVSIFGVAIGIVVMLGFVLYPYPYGDESLRALLLPAIIALAGMMFTTFAYPNISSVFSEVIEPEYRATAFAVFNILNNLGWGIGPTLYGLLKAEFYEVLGLDISSASRYAITSIVLLWIIPLVIWILMLRLYPKYKK